MNEQILSLFKSYLPKAVNGSGEFLFPPDLAIEFIEKLSIVGVIVTGFESWKYVDEINKTGPVLEICGGWQYIDESVSTPGEHAKMVIKFIKERLPNDAQLISPQYKEGEEYYTLMEDLLGLSDGIN